MYEKEKRELLETALEMKYNRLISLSGGNVSCRVGENLFIVTPSGMRYEDLVPDDICLINEKGETVEGTRKPSSDTEALLYMFKSLPHINAIIHTHQPWATAAGFITDSLPEFLVTIIDACRNPVNVAPFTPSSAIGMGTLAVEFIGEALAVILKHHGVIAVGKDLDEALYSAVYLEEAAKTYVLAKAAGGDIPPLDPALIELEKDGWASYGQ